MFKLELLIYIRIYLVFHILLLKKVFKNVKRELVHINKEIQEPLYEVNNIIEYKLD